MKSLSDILFPACIAAAIAGGTAWVLATRAPLAHAVLGIDPSLSVSRNCAGLVEASIAMVEEQDGIGEGSMLAVLAMGTNPGAPEPAMLSSTPVPIASGKVYGRDTEGFRERREAFFGSIEAACESLENSAHSPIYRLVVGGVATLRSLGCGPEGRCYLLIKSDLNEDVDPRLRKALQQAATQSGVEIGPELTGSIENAGVEIAFCGTAEMQPSSKRTKHQPASPEKRVRIWQSLFTHPELVSFSPYCGQ